MALTSKIADFVVSVGLDSRVRSQGSISDALAKDEVLAKEVSEDRQILEAVEKEIDPPAADELKQTTDGKLIVVEEIALGHVTWSALNLFFRGIGGNHTVLFFLVFIIAIVVTEGAVALQTWYLGIFPHCISHSRWLT